MLAGRTPATTFLVAAFMLAGRASLGAAAPAPGPSTAEARGSTDAERLGTHDGGNLRTRFWNFGMVGDYPVDPLHVDLSTFHSLEAPKGSGMNYSDGLTPFVLARVPRSGGATLYLMETGFRERQAISPYTGQVMRFEPRPGFFEADSSRNVTRSPAISDRPETWPAFWPDRMNDPIDPGWPGKWNGFFGKHAAADQESYIVMDDQAYDAWPDIVPDATDPTRRGLGLRLAMRGLQWHEGTVRDVLFLNYDLTNEGTTLYDDNLIFGIYFDAGIGGSALSCDGLFESDDDNAYWDTSPGRSLAYAWDRYGHGVDLSGTCDQTGVIGCGFLQTAGESADGIDNDHDGIVDESPASGPGMLISSQAAIASYVDTHYDRVAFEARYGRLTDRPAYQAGRWWTGDEDLDWTLADDVGADGTPGTNDVGEGDGIPTQGEPHFDRNDVDEVDQLGLTGFKMDRIHAGAGNPDPTTDNILFYDDGRQWPQRLWQQFTDPNPAARFDSALTSNYNIAFLTASGPFRLAPGETQRFSVAIAREPDLDWLRQTMALAQMVHEGGYRQLVEVPERIGSSRGYLLLGNRPNPFRGATRIAFRLPERARVGLQLFDLQGRQVASGDRGVMAAGAHEVALQIPARAPGVYFYRLSFEDPATGTLRTTLSGRMLVLD